MKFAFTLTESVNSCLSELQGATKDNDINDGEEGKSPDSSETKTNCIQEVRCPKGHPLDFVPVLGVEWICAVTQQGHGKEGGDGLKCPPMRRDRGWYRKQ